MPRVTTKCLLTPRYSPIEILDVFFKLVSKAGFEFPLMSMPGAHFADLAELTRRIIVQMQPVGEPPGQAFLVKSKHQSGVGFVPTSTHGKISKLRMPSDVQYVML